MNLCRSGESIDGCISRDYFKISANPSTTIIGCEGCGLIFDQADSGMLKRYYSKIKPKSLRIKSHEEDNFCGTDMTRPFMEVEMLRSCGEADAFQTIRPVECDIQCQ
jgi:hypothetical protein